MSSTVTFGYDDITNNNKGYGRRTSLSDSSDVVHPRNTQTWQYDLQGRVVSTAQTIPGAPANPYTTAFAYDAMDRVRTMTYPDGEVVTTSYNAQGLPDTLNGANSYVSATTYNAASQLDSLTFGNGALTDYVYNAQNLRLTDIVTTKSGNTLLNLHYTFDNVGNILSVQGNARGETTNYSYDDLNRLMSASITTGGNQYSRSWQYDAIGNMQTRVEGGVTTTYQYNDATSKHAVTHLNNVLKYQYDPNGNMTTRDGDTLTYDVENRLTSVTKAGATTTFAYNGDGARVKRSVSNAGTTYYVGNYFEVYVPNGGSATFNKYYYFGSQRVAAKIAGTLFYLQGDHLASSSVVMTQAGTSFYTRQTYFPYGAQRTTEGSALPTDYTFTSQKSDDSTGLMFYGARYYDATLGRFTQPDTIVPHPLNPQSLNRFAYVLNNPVRYIDPSGHIPCEDQDDCNPGQGGDDQPGNDPNVQPPTEPPYCEQYPEANGCAVLLPANTDDNQGPDDEGACNVAQCEGEEPSEQSKPEVASCTPGSSKSCSIFPGFQPPSFLPRNWTITVGAGVVLEAVLGFQMDVGALSLDSNGQLQFLSVSPGGRLSSGFGAALDGFVMVTNAKSLNDLSAWSVNAGANGGPVSVDAVWGKNHSYDGIRLGYGAKGTVTVFPSPSGVPVPVPAEVHGGASYTFMSPYHVWLW